MPCTQKLHHEPSSIFKTTYDIRHLCSQQLSNFMLLNNRSLDWLQGDHQVLTDSKHINVRVLLIACQHEVTILVLQPFL